MGGSKGGTRRNPLEAMMSGIPGRRLKSHGGGGGLDATAEGLPFASVITPRRGVVSLIDKFRKEAGRRVARRAALRKTAAPPQVNAKSSKQDPRRFPPAEGKAGGGKARGSKLPGAALASAAMVGASAAPAPAAAAAAGIIAVSEADLEGELVHEMTNGRRSVYSSGKGKGKGSKGKAAGFETRHLKSDLPALQELRRRAANYLLPDGYPNTVSAEFTPYMQWRGVQYFFGGAMSVFTTRSLLSSLGVGRATETAAAINWVLKDGAGRMGKFVFARFGKKLDCETKQFRLAGDVLMELGAGVEMTTILAPQFFLPLACAANLAKNVAAASASSTRAPIYRQFALNNNLGDVTAKGESVGNLADMLGTCMGICLSRANPPLFLTFAVLSTGYVTGSFNEVSVVRLPYLNRARLGVAVRTYLKEGRVPGVGEANKQEPLILLPADLPMPWAQERPIKIGTTVAEACETPRDYKVAERLFGKEKFMVCYRPKKRQTYVLLKEGAKSKDMLKGAFQAHLLMHLLEERGRDESCPGGGGGGGAGGGRGAKIRGDMLAFHTRHSREQVEAALVESCRVCDGSFDTFLKGAAAQGWVTNDTLLNPGDSRVIA